MNASECLRAAARIESLARDLYAELSGIFTHQPFLRDLFEKLAVEEAQHAMRIRLLERQHGRRPWSEEKLRELETELREMTAEVEAVRKLARSAAGGRDAGALLRRLTAMEARFGAIHAEELARSAAPEVQRLFASLAKQDAKHSEMLRKASTRVTV